MEVSKQCKLYFMSTAVKLNLKQIFEDFKNSISINQDYYKLIKLKDQNTGENYLVLHQLVINPFEADGECDATFATLSSDPFVFDPDEIITRNEIYKIENNKLKFVKTYMCLLDDFEINNVLNSVNEMNINEYINRITDTNCSLGIAIRMANNNYFYKVVKHNNSVFLLVYYVTVPVKRSKWGYWSCSDGNKYRCIDNIETSITTEFYDITDIYSNDDIETIYNIMMNKNNNINLIAILHNKININFNELEQIKENYDNTKTVTIIEN
jgi:hypothetical protein